MKCSYCDKEIDEEQALKKKNDALKAHHPTVEYYQSGKWFCDENCGHHYFMRMTIDEFHDQIRSFMNNEKGSRIRLSDNKIEEEFERILRRR